MHFNAPFRPRFRVVFADLSTFPMIFLHFSMIFPMRSRGRLLTGAAEVRSGRPQRIAAQGGEDCPGGDRRDECAATALVILEEKAHEPETAAVLAMYLESEETAKMIVSSDDPARFL